LLSNAIDNKTIKQKQQNEILRTRTVQIRSRVLIFIYTFINFTNIIKTSVLIEKALEIVESTTVYKIINKNNKKN